MPSRNDVTGDSLVSKSSNENYRSNWDKIFGKKESREENSENSDKEKQKRED